MRASRHPPAPPRTPSCRAGRNRRANLVRSQLFGLVSKRRCDQADRRPPRNYQPRPLVGFENAHRAGAQTRVGWSALISDAVPRSLTLQPPQVARLQLINAASRRFIASPSKPRSGSHDSSSSNASPGAPAPLASRRHTTLVRVAHPQERIHLSAVVSFEKKPTLGNSAIIAPLL